MAEEIRLADGQLVGEFVALGAAFLRVGDELVIGGAVRGTDGLDAAADHLGKLVVLVGEELHAGGLDDRPLSSRKTDRT